MKLHAETLPLSKALLMLVAGLIMGTVFVFGMRFWNAEVERESCVQVEAQFEDYREDRRRGRVEHIYIDCTDGETYVIDGACLTDAVEDAVAGLGAGDKLTMLLHPNGDSVVELICDGEEIVNFDEAMEQLDGERVGFFFLGIFAYFCAAVGLYYTLRHIARRAKG